MRASSKAAMAATERLLTAKRRFARSRWRRPIRACTNASVRHDDAMADQTTETQLVTWFGGVEPPVAAATRAGLEFASSQDGKAERSSGVRAPDPRSLDVLP
jgi:hypothetical protein